MSNVIRSLKVISVSKKEGKGKESGKPYSMLLIEGVATCEDGALHIAEVSIFTEPGKDYSHIRPDGVYIPYVAVGIDFGKKVDPRVVDLRPVQSSKQAATA